MIDLLGLGYLGVFLLSFILNMLPFMSPSNLLLSGAVGVALPWMNPLLIGFLIALASSLAKLIHFYSVFFAGRALRISDSRLEGYRRRVGRIGPLLLFLAAASPIPDEPVVISLGLLRYSSARFFLFFFSGKILITTLGASAGSRVSLSLGNFLGSPIMVASSVILTVAATYLLVKIDLEDLTRRVLNKIRQKFSDDNP